MTPRLRLGARTSPLARVQAEHVAALLAERGVNSEFVGITTTGDVDQRALTEIGGTGVFASAVRDALRAGTIDVAVHSLKDLPTGREPDLTVAAIPPREDPRDVLVGRRLHQLRDHSRVGTGSPRRAMQLLDYGEQRRVRLDVVPIRGNVDTRLARVRNGSVDAVVLAAAGLRRLGYLPREESQEGTEVCGLPAEILPSELMLPAPGQGALALEISRSLPEGVAQLITALDDPTSRAESLAERAFLAALEAGCTAPVGAQATITGRPRLALDLTLRVVIGRTLLSDSSGPANAAPVRRTLSGTATDPGQFGEAAGRRLLEELSDQQRAHQQER